MARLPAMPVSVANRVRRVEEDLPLGFVAQPARRLQATASTDPIMRAERTLLMSQLASEQAAAAASAARARATATLPAGLPGFHHSAPSALNTGSAELNQLRLQLAASNTELASVRAELTSRTEEAELLRRQLHRVLDVSKRLLKHVSPALAVEVAHSFAEALVGSVHPRFSVGSNGRLAAAPPLAGASHESEPESDEFGSEAHKPAAPDSSESGQATTFEIDSALAAAFQRAAGALVAIPRPGTAAFPVAATPTGSPARHAISDDSAPTAAASSPPPVHTAMREFQALLAAAGVGTAPSASSSASASASASPNRTQPQLQLHSQAQLRPTPGRAAGSGSGSGIAGQGASGSGNRSAGVSPDSEGSAMLGGDGDGDAYADADANGDGDGSSMAMSMDRRAGRGSLSSVEREMQDVRGLYNFGVALGTSSVSGTSGTAARFSGISAAGASKPQTRSGTYASHQQREAASAPAPAVVSSARVGARVGAGVGHGPGIGRRVLRLDEHGMLVAAEASPRATDVDAAIGTGERNRSEQWQVQREVSLRHGGDRVDGATHHTASGLRAVEDVESRLAEVSTAPQAASTMAARAPAQGTGSSSSQGQHGSNDPHREVDFSALMRRINALAARNDAALADTS